MPGGSFGTTRPRKGLPATKLTPPPPPTPLQAAATATVQRIQQPFAVVQDDVGNAFTADIRTALRGDINRDVVAQAQQDPITQALLANYNADAERVREQQQQELARLGILRPGGSAGATADILGEFDANVFRGRGDILAQGVRRGLDERRASLGQGLSLADLTNRQNLDAQALEQSIRQGNIGQGLTAATVAANQQGLRDQQRLAEAELLGILDGQQTQRAREFEQGLDFEGRRLAQQQGQFEAGLGQQATEFVQQQGLRNLQFAEDKRRFDAAIAQQEAERAQAVEQAALGRSFAGEQSALDRALAERLQGGELGLEQQRLAQQQGQFDAGQAFAGSQADLDRAQQRDLLLRQLGFQGSQNAADRTLAREQLGEGARQFDAGLGFEGRRLDQQGRQFDRSLAQADRQFGSNLGLENRRLAEQARQFDTSTNEAVNAQTRQNMFELQRQADALAFQEGQAGLDRQQALNLLSRQQGFQGAQNAAERALARQLQGGELGLERERLAQQQGQFEDTLGVQQGQLDLSRDQFNASTLAQQRAQDLAAAELFGGTQIALNSTASQGDFFREVDRVTAMARRELGRDLTPQELQTLMGGGTIAGRQTLGAQQLAQQQAFQRAGLTGKLDGDDTLAAQQLAQQGDQFAQSLAQADRQFGSQLGLQNRQLTEQGRQFDADLALRDALRGDASDQFTRSLNQADRQFGSQLGLQNRQLSEQGRQFNASLGLDRDRLAQADRQFGSQLGFQNRQLAQQGQQFDADLALRQALRGDANSQFTRELGFRGAQAAADRGLTREQMAQQGGQFDADLALRQALRGDASSQFDRGLDEQIRQADLGQGNFDRAFEAEEGQNAARNEIDIINAILGFEKADVDIASDQAIMDRLTDALGLSRRTVVAGDNIGTDKPGDRPGRGPVNIGNGQVLDDNLQVDVGVPDKIPAGSININMDDIYQFARDQGHTDDPLLPENRGGAGKAVAPYADNRYLTAPPPRTADSVVERIGRTNTVSMKDIQSMSWMDLAAAINALPGGINIRKLGPGLKLLRAGHNVDSVVRSFKDMGFDVGP